MFSQAIRLDYCAIIQIDCSPMTRYLMQHRMILEYVLNAQQQLAQMKWLGNEFLCANFETFQPMFGGAQGGHKHNRQ